MSFLALDPPRHTRMRALVSEGFTARRVRELEQQIRELAVAHLGAALPRGEFDFVADFAGLLPMDVISRDDRRAPGRPRPAAHGWRTPWCTAKTACSTCRRPAWRPR